jgi:hypothetical protein
MHQQNTGKQLQKLSFMEDLTRFSDYVLAWYSEGPESDFNIITRDRNKVNS